MTQLEALAREFSRLLWLNVPEKNMHTAIRRNRAEDDYRVCHTIDFCDASDYLASAYYNVTDQQADGEQATTQMNNAWQLAKSNEFYLSEK